MRRLIAFDANPLTRPAVTGTELIARELAFRLPSLIPESRWTFYSGRPAPGLGLDLTVLPMSRLWSQLRLPAELLRRPPDLLFAPSHVVPFLAACPALTIIHDLAFEHFPAAYGTAARRYLQLTTRFAERRCRVLLTVSESTKRDLVQLHGISPERIIVALPGAGTPPSAARPPAGDEARLAELGLKSEFILQVGRVEPRKNQLAALAAVESLPGLRLACAGTVSDERMAGRLRASASAVVLGRVEPEDLALLYRRAAAVVVPSLYEGFGFPVLEAMAAGAPVVTSRRSSLSEVGGEAVLYVDDPADTGSLARALAGAIAEPLRGRLIEAGRRRASEFTWERFAGTVAGVIRSLLQPDLQAPPRSAPPTGPS